MSALRVEMVSVDETDWSPMYREVMPDTFVTVGLLYGAHATTDDYLRAAFAAMRDVETDDALHRARVQAKRLRYAAEVDGDDKVVARAKEFQDVVGEHQDAVVAEDRLRALAKPSTALLVGRLVERQALRRAAARRVVPKAWKRLEKTTG